MSTDKQAKEPAMDLTREGLSKEAGGWLGAHLTSTTPESLMSLLERVRDAADAAARAEEKGTFARLRVVNVARCIEGFKHTLASWSVAEWTNALCGEAGEAANVAKKLLRFRDGVAGNKGADLDKETLRQKLGRELADVVIYADLVAASLGLDLGNSVRDTFNAKSEELGVGHRLWAAPVQGQEPALITDHEFQPCDIAKGCDNKGCHFVPGHAAPCGQPRERHATREELTKENHANRVAEDTGEDRAGFDRGGLRAWHR